MRDQIEYALRELKRRKRRSVASIIGYAAAVAAMVVLINVILFAKAGEDNILNNTGTHFMAFMPYVEKDPLTSCPPGQCSIVPKNEEDEGFIADTTFTAVMKSEIISKALDIEAVKDASPYIKFRMKKSNGNHYFNIGGIRTDNSTAVRTTCCSASDVKTGRFLEQGERGAVVIEEAYAKIYHLKAGEKFDISGKDFIIAGIINAGIRPAKADVFMNIDDASEIIEKKLNVKLDGGFNCVLVEVASSKTQKEAMDSVKALIGANGVISTYNCYKPAAKVMGMNENAILLLTVIIIICTILFSLKTSYASVIERSHDIGILKAIGWTNKNVISQFVWQSLMQAVIGGAIGCLIACLAIVLLPVKAIINIETVGNLSISWTVVIAGALLALISGVVAGFLPALSITRKKPAEVLRRI